MAMKLTDLIYSASSYYRNVENFLRHPFEMLSQQGRRMAQDKLENIEVPTGQRHSRSSADAKVETDTGNRRSPQQIPQRAIAVATPERGIQLPLQSTAAAWNSPRSAEPPLLSEQDQIRGRWGRYRRVGEVRKMTERVRWYDGMLVLNNKPVLIKEFLLLDREFNPREIRERKEKFAFLSNLNLRNGGGQDFRLVNLCEAIASPNADEHRCYLISEPIPHSQTLGEYLATTQATLSDRQVQYLLNQMLQTLWFLHHQKVRFLNGDVQHGIPHGNLGLDSLLIAYPSTPEPQADELQFFVYVTDLALWEHLFLPAADKLPSPTAAQDLIDLGYVAFYLLTGRPPQPEQRPNLLLEQPWATVSDRPLKQFIRQLVGGEFKSSAEAARQTLLNLPEPERSPESISPVEIDPITAVVQTKRLRQLVTLGLLGGCLGGLLWLGWRWFEGQSRFANTPTPNPCCLATIPNLPTGEIAYVTEASGIWSHILQAQNLVAFDQSLEQVLAERDPRLEKYRLQITPDDPLAVLRSGQADFALTEWRNDLPEDFAQQEVAYDGLVFVVAFGDAQRSQSIPEALHGKISFEQLRQLYVGESDRFRDAKTLNNQSIQLYRPNDRKAVDLFKRLVLKNDRDAIDRFEQLAIVTLPTTQLFGEILKDFEQQNTIGIGFARLSQVINQCSVYPLAVGEPRHEVQALVQNTGQAIDPSTDLCGDKGSYRSNVNAFSTEQPFSQNSYPLRYRLAVVYRQDSQAGQRFAAALKTDEGQALLSAAGLVSLRQFTHPKNRVSFKL